MKTNCMLLVRALAAMAAALALPGCPSGKTPGPPEPEAAAKAPEKKSAPAGSQGNGPVKPAPSKPVCASCHEQQYKFWAYGGHSSNACVDCHGEPGDHAIEKIDPRPKMKKLERELCLECHDLAKSGGVKEKITTDQLVEKHMDFLDSKHVIKLDRAKIKGRCLHCHDPHMGR